MWYYLWEEEKGKMNRKMEEMTFQDSNLHHCQNRLGGCGAEEKEEILRNKEVTESLFKSIDF